MCDTPQCSLDRVDGQPRGNCKTPKLFQTITPKLLPTGIRRRVRPEAGACDNPNVAWLTVGWKSNIDHEQRIFRLNRATVRIVLSRTGLRPVPEFPAANAAGWRRPVLPAPMFWFPTRKATCVGKPGSRKPDCAGKSGTGRRPVLLGGEKLCAFVYVLLL
jgi:hypothetical protein